MKEAKVFLIKLSKLALGVLMTLVVCGSLMGEIMGDKHSFKATFFDERLAFAEKKLSEKSFESANEIAKTAIRSLGKCYMIQGLRDDTGLKLALADAKEQTGEFEIAANVRIGVLKVRLNGCKRRYKDTPCK